MIENSALFHLAATSTTANNLLDQYEKTGGKKEVCLSAPGKSGCYRTGIAAALGDPNHLEDRTEPGRKKYK